MIDSEGFRANVGIIVCNESGQLLWTRRAGQNSWQFPQGGVNEGETPDETMFRELYEEIGLSRQDVKVLGSTKNWLRYRLPSRYIRHDSVPLCIGQKQKWYLLKLTSDDSRLDFATTNHPEFDDFMWVGYWYPLRQVVAFKREVYRQALLELLPMVHEQQRLQRQKRGRRRHHHRRPQNG
ncbi:RNA pyrophosphohydrolase [Pleionea litopenaei]|uniref:RNA pyrophosphohydrolase n=1 Tax=Pleionea litopenaei TaxID=3070815 RepID=A0AA51RQG2_9GAMM|nr:RNA pyrophosphohydrolase [Pleionea sp. HL-JVS1]WMS85758.1 RNA pyrophosphohydrolase [Pleionea sp. HL-JVS1]